MSSTQNRNQYSIYVVYMNNNVSCDISKVTSEVSNMLSTKENPFLFIRNFPVRRKNEQGELVTTQTNRFLVCMKKDHFNTLRNDIGKDKPINITKFNVNSVKMRRGNHFRARDMKPGLTYSFYVRGNQLLRTTFETLLNDFVEAGFLRPGSYRIITPKRFESRNYFFVVFDRVEGRFPKDYIITLRTLLNESLVDGQHISVDWAASSVISDVEKGADKGSQEVLTSA